MCIPEKAVAPHSSTLAWKIPWMEEPGRLQSMGHKESDTTEWLHFHFSLSCIGEENGNPLQCSCLENPRDGGAWWAAISGVAQSQTRLKLLSSSSSIFWKYSFLKKHISCSNCVAISYVQIAHYFLLYVDGLYTFSRPLQTLGFYGFKAMKSKASLPR